MTSGSRQGVLLLNLGTPDSPSTRDVRRYLREFLSDPRVLDIPALGRSLLLNLVILPFRSARSAAAYEQVWGERGSPLKYHLEDLASALAGRLGDEVPVEVAMRYRQPSIASALDRLHAREVDHVHAVLLFPQYAPSSWGSAAEELYRRAGDRWNTPALTLVPPFYRHPAFVRAVAAVARPHLQAFRPDYVLFSFHGLPERQIRKSDESGGAHCLRSAGCCDEIVSANRHCYRAQSFATAAAVAEALQLETGVWEVAFQSRLGRTPWIRPYTDQRLPQLAVGGKRRLAVLCPSFVADCLETLEEIGIRGRAAWKAAGGEELELIPCLNADGEWVTGLREILAEQGI